MRKCNSLIRANARALDRDMSSLRALDSKTRGLILSASKRATKAPPTSPLHAQALSETRTFARELLRIRRQASRLATSKAQLESVGMQVREAFSVKKIEGSIKASTGIMRDVNSLVRMPELTGTMRELSEELMKAGIIEEMVGDTLPDGELVEGEEEEAESEVDRVLGEVLGTKIGKVNVPADPVVEDSGPALTSDEVDIDSEAMLDQMRGRLEALKS